MEARSFWVPKGAVKVVPKNVNAVFYLYESAKGPSAMCFVGSAAKPAWRYYFKTVEGRDKRIAEQMKALAARAEMMDERKAKANVPSKIEVGHVFVTSWGYDQTNIEFFKVIEKKGLQTVVVQEVEKISANKGDEAWLTGKALPGEAFAKGSKPYTVRVSHGNSAKIEGHYASLWNGQPVSWTAYH